MNSAWAIAPPAAGKGLQVLLIEDNPVDTTMVKAMLHEMMGTAFTCTSVPTLAEGLVALAGATVSCVLLDLDLLDSEGLGTLDAVLAARPEPAVIVLTGLDDDSVGDAAVARGAQDYLVKNKADADLLCRAARYAVERKHIQLSLTRERQILELIARDMPLELILERLVVAVEREVAGGRCELVIQTDGPVTRHRIVAPSFSARYIDGLERLARSGAATPHATVATEGAARVAVGTGAALGASSGGLDVWPQWHELGEAESLAAMWMVPVSSPQISLGTLAVYPPEPRQPTTAELDVLQASATLVALAVERHQTKQTLADQATHDELTGLPNRFLLIDRLDQALREGARHGTGTAALFLDLDHFKLINDGLGHPVGDQVLREAARRMSASVRSGDTLARFGGDEFVVVCPNLLGAQHATRVARRILASMETPFDVGATERVLSASVGMAICTGDGQSADDLLRDADAAMYRAKELGRNRLEIFDEGTRQLVLARLDAEDGLRRAVERQELVLHYQPQVELCSRRVLGSEALVRWDHPDRGLVLPETFIPIAEESGLFVDLGSWVLRQACADAAEWAKDGGPPRISVNLSARHVAEGRIVADVAAALSETGLPASQLCLEVTETVLMEESGRLAETLRGLAGLGVRLSIDDFGTGFGALSYLKRVPVDELKINMSFVAGLGVDVADEAIVAGIIGMGRALGLDVVAEGVETDLQAARLIDLGCNRAQGYLFGHPLPVGDLLSLRSPACTWLG
jgi:diguanylate cyclase (GGDEF)-like protein